MRRKHRGVWADVVRCLIALLIYGTSVAISFSIIWWIAKFLMETVTDGKPEQVQVWATNTLWPAVSRLLGI